MRILRIGLLKDKTMSANWTVDHKFFSIEQGHALGVFLRKVFILMLETKNPICHKITEL